MRFLIPKFADCTCSVPRPTASTVIILLIFPIRNSITWVLLTSAGNTRTSVFMKLRRRGKVWANSDRKSVVEGESVDIGGGRVLEERVRTRGAGRHRRTD